MNYLKVVVPLDGAIGLSFEFSSSSTWTSQIPLHPIGINDACKIEKANNEYEE
jgi:hypothetical protein